MDSNSIYEDAIEDNPVMKNRKSTSRTNGHLPKDTNEETSFLTADDGANLSANNAKQKKVVFKDPSAAPSQNGDDSDLEHEETRCMPAVAQRAVSKAHQVSSLSIIQVSLCKFFIFSQAVESVEEFMFAVWSVVSHHSLPEWLKDNDFLITGHRPQLNSYWACFKSIFRIHTETGNIWSHLLGCIMFIVIFIYFNTRPEEEIQFQEKAIFSTFFVAAILCLGFSWLFHTLYCHSERVGKMFNKLDYCGISIMVMGSFIPWLYYCFYCDLLPKIIYLSIVSCFGTACIVVSLWEKFATPEYRSLRAGLFIAFGLSGVIPVLHYIIVHGFHDAIYVAAIGWLVLMAILYIGGAVIYAYRFPERMYPGKFDIWFQSHQIFHVCVVAAAFVHYHGISTLAQNKLKLGDCPTPLKTTSPFEGYV